MATTRRGSSAASPGSSEYRSIDPPSSDPVGGSTPDIGDAPGSSAYFGNIGTAEGTDLLSSSGEMVVADAGPGDPPGSAAYFGLEEAALAASRGPDGAELSLPTVGELPGSSSYYGASQEEDRQSAVRNTFGGTPDR